MQMSLETYYDNQYFKYLDEGYSHVKASAMAMSDCRKKFEEITECKNCCPNGCRGAC
ncbi:hypothetical protein [Leptospira phage LE4]|uniref:Uncharacterized protein n=1 Tax=Leptospira phage LE4 TaxID=2041383 RepID=A0A343LEB0_9CAUD|nr:hypothetical protein HWB34_gp07 [Leptospira phage LE4]ATN95020.1 hypothetical protein [Leptospira phage LE4]